MPRWPNNIPWEERFVYDSSFDDSKVANDLLNYATVSGVGTEAKKLPKVPIEVPYHLNKLYQFPVLTRYGERMLFLKMNCAKYQISKLRKDCGLSNQIKRKIEQLTKLAYDVRNEIANHNLRLVVSVIKTLRPCGLSHDELISDGNISLLKTIDKFNCNIVNNTGNTNKFSTYAVNAILRNYWRDIAVYERKQARQSSIDSDSFDESLLAGNDYDDDNEVEVKRVMKIVQSRLNKREQAIVQMRFGLNSPATYALTLTEIGARFCISKERARQLLKKAIEKLRLSLGLPIPMVKRKYKQKIKAPHFKKTMAKAG